MPNHTGIPDECFANEIHSLSEICDNEYYMSAINPPVGDFQRAIRGRDRIIKSIEEFEGLKILCQCSACKQEIEDQINIQKESILEINGIWSLQ